MIRVFRITSNLLTIRRIVNGRIRLTLTRERLK